MKNNYRINTDGDVAIKVSHLGHDLELLVDSQGFETLNELNGKISARKCGGSIYFTVRVLGKNAYVHRILTKCPNDKVVDHINRNTLDNRMSNLRVVSRSQNMLNLSGVRGVDRNKETGKWRARIFINGIEYHLGYFEHKEEAYAARKEAEINLLAEVV